MVFPNQHRVQEEIPGSSERMVFIRRMRAEGWNAIVEDAGSLAGEVVLIDLQDVVVEPDDL